MRSLIKTSPDPLIGEFWDACYQGHLGAASLDLAGRFLGVNKWLSELVGFTSEELVGRYAKEITSPETALQGRFELQKSLPGTVTHTSEIQLLRKGLEPVWINSHLTLERFSATQLPRNFIWIVEDISSRKRAEGALRKYQDSYREITDASTDIFITLDSNLRYTFWNKAAELLTGIPTSKVIGMKFGELLTENPALQSLGQHYEAALRTNEKQTFTAEIPINGKRNVIEVSVCPLLSGISVFGRDITNEKTATAALVTTEEKYSKLFRANPSIVILSTLKDGVAVEVNDAFESVTGYSREEALGKSISSLGIWVDMSHRDRLVEKLIAQGKLRDEECLYRSKTGRVFPALVSTELIDLENEKHILSVIVDITSLKRVEEELRRNEQIRKELSGHLLTGQEEERRRIARELHDDIGQDLALLGVRIKRAAQFDVHADDQKKEQAAELYEGVQKVANKITRLSHQLHSSELEYLGLTVGIESLCREFAVEHNLTVNCVCGKIPNAPDNISLCLYRITQESLRNIVRHSGATQVEVSLQKNEGEISLSVRDNGVGFVVREGESKNGLGLISMRERLNQMSGELLLESTPGTGTTVLARIPLRVETTSKVKRAR